MTKAKLRISNTAIIIVLAFLFVWGLPQCTHAQQEQGVCAQVKIQLSQSVAITRTAFQATLQISNSQANVPLQKVQVILDIRDSAGNSANSRFGISNPVLTSISDVAGGGTITPGAQATAVWTILPTRDAAPTVDTQYTVGGTISYAQAGVHVSLPLFPAPITVKPDPLLQFHYFLERTVYGDDPFTPEVEPSIPFSLGLLVVNKGAGTAHDLTITSSQPKIVDNQKGLLISFHILGTSVNGVSVSPSLTADLGDVGPGNTSVADFLLISSLQGSFIGFNATFKHNDDLNNPRTSILDSVDTHFLEHVVRIVEPTDDGKPDFLYFSTDPTAAPDPAPDTVQSSDGTIAAVTPILNAVTDGPASNSDLVVHLTIPATVPSGFVYIRTEDPGQNLYQLTSVVRSDGTVIALGDNAWTTHRIIRLQGQAPTPQNRLYLFDSGTTGAYTLTYAPLMAVKPTVALTSPQDRATFSPKTTIILSATAASTQTIVKEVDFYADGKPVGVSTATPFVVSYKPVVGPHIIKAIAIDANGVASDPAQITVTVNPSANKPPVISLTGPQDKGDIIEPATITLSAAASDLDGSIAKVDFYSNGTFLGSSITPPYITTLENQTSGTYDFTAVATDNQGATTTSNSLSVLVQSSITGTGMPILRGVSAVSQGASGQLLMTLQNSTSMNAVNITLNIASIQWGGKSATSIVPTAIPMLAPNSTATFMLQFPPGTTGPFVKVFGTYSGHHFSGLAPVTP